MAVHATDTTIELIGGCLCGAVRYRATGDAKWVAYCHCASCRRATGAPVTAFAGFERDRFAYLEGEPRRFRSSPGVVRSFCGDCGTPLTYEGERWPSEVHIHLGTLDRPELVVPEGHAFEEERLPWLQIDRAS